MITIPSNLLTYSSKTKTFTGFLSDFMKVELYMPTLIEIESHKTGVKKIFEFGDADCIDGDTTAYFYICKSDDLHLTLYND